MKTAKRFSFIRTTIVGGLIFLVPIIVLTIIFSKALVITREIVGPLADLIPFEAVVGIGVAKLLAISVIFLFCFFTGLFAKTDLARKIVDGLETRLLSNIPGYTFMKRIGESFIGGDMDQGYEVVLAQIEDAWQIAFLIERIKGGHVAVFVPGAPSPWSGSVFFMTEDRIKTIEVPHKDAIKCVQRLGAGSNSLLQNYI